MPLAFDSRLNLSAGARNLHSRAAVVDTHADTTQRLVLDTFDLNERHGDGAIDIPRMREGGLAGIFFAVWVPGTVTGMEAVERARRQIEAILKHVSLHPTDLVLARTAEDIGNARSSGRIAVLMGIEGGHMIGHDLRILREFASLGVSYMTLTHALNTDWADASTDEPRHNGLSDFGKQVISEMNRLGMIVDVSHVSDKTFYDTLAISDAPLLASHSCCRVLCATPRNMSDDLIRALAARRGVIQINFHMGFLSQEFCDAEKAKPELDKRIAEVVDGLCGENAACRMLESDRIIREFVAEGKLPRVDWTAILDHIDHAVNVAGINHVGLGSDFDGAHMPYGMEDASCLPSITEGLLQRGYSENDILQILGGNALRLMQEVEVATKSKRGSIA